ncbi:MAG: PAS domain S-box protein [Acidimicrobiales bacterium]
MLSISDFSQFVSAAPDAVVVVDSTGCIIFVNDQAERLFGYSATEIIGQSVEQLVPLGLADEHKMLRLDYSKDPQSRRMADPAAQVRVRRADGSAVPVDIALSPVWLGEELAVMATIRDVSISSAADAALRSSEALYRSAFDNAAVAVAITDISDPVKRPILDANEALGEMLGYSRDDLCSMGFDELTHPDDRLASRLAAEDRARAGGSISRLEKRYIHADGSTVWGALQAVVIERADGGRVSLAQIIDITRRVRAEYDRDRRERFLRMLGDFGTAVLSGKPRAEQLQLICTSLVQIHDAAFAAVLIPDADGLRILSFATTSGSEVPSTRLVPFDDDIEAVFGEPDPKVFNFWDLERRERFDGWAAGNETIVAPLRAHNIFEGLVVVGRGIGAEPYDDQDHEIMTSVAHNTALVLELARARRTERLLLLAEERDRIGRDLNDLVIQRLFAAGMHMQSSLADPSSLPEKVRNLVGELDETIAVIRDSIFELAGTGTDPRAQLMIVAETHLLAGGTDITVGIEGDLESVDATVVAHLIAVLNESLSNVLLHASASKVDVQLRVDDRVSMSVIDDGVGFDSASERGFGLTNFETRANELGGEVSVVAGPRGGTIVHWVVPRIPDP